MAAPDVLDRLRQPQYTGENRCIPCTAVNAAIATVLAAAVAAAALAVDAGALVAAGASVAVLALSAAAIYLRGYLVPGTPWFTKTYFPDWVLRRFDKHPAGADRDDGEFDVEATLKRAGALEECAREDDLCLTDEFRAAWRERIAAVREADTSRDELARILDVDPDRLAIEDYGEAFVAWLDGQRAGQWESRAAFLADVAAANELRERVGGWAAIDVQHRSSVLQGLRIFLERCPDCDAPVTIDEEFVESCCRSIDVVAVTCGDCGARVFEAERPS